MALHRFRPPSFAERRMREAQKKIAEQDAALIDAQIMTAELYEQNELLQQNVIDAQMMIAELYEGSEA